MVGRLFPGDSRIVRRALRTALLVGCLLTAINHGPALLGGDVTVGRLSQIGLTFLVPFAVSTHASRAARREGGDR